MNKIFVIVGILALLILGYNIVVVSYNIANPPIDSIMQTEKSIVNLIMISRVNQLIAFLMTILVVIIGPGKTKKEKIRFWTLLSIIFINAFAVFGVAKYLSMYYL